MPRSLRVAEEFIPKVKDAVQRQGYRRQKDLADDVGVSLDTVRKFLNGKAIDFGNFVEICFKLGLDREAIAASNYNGSDSLIASAKPLVFLDGTETDDFIYIERQQIESHCDRTLRQPGALLRIKAPGLMGKTAMMAKILPKMALQGYRTAYLNLHLAETTDFTSLDKFLQWFCISVGQNLEMPNKLVDYWDERYSTSKMNCNAYFEEYLLAASNSPLVLCLDEVERVFPHQSVAVDFLGLLRAWHEQAKVRNVWKRLRLVIVHSTEVYVEMNLNESPFNVGEPIELPELSQEQVQNFARQYKFTGDLVWVKQLMDVVGGHPYLVQQALSHLQNNPDVTLEQVLQTAATEAGIYANHLRRYGNIIEKHDELKEAFRKVVAATATASIEPMQAYKLYSMGLVQRVGDDVKVSCNLYRQYFQNRFGVS